MALAPSAVVTAIYNGETATGLRAVADAQTDMDLLGELGVTINSFRVSAANMSEPTRGATMIIDGADVKVTECRTDPLTATRLIMYEVSRPVSGV